MINLFFIIHDYSGARTYANELLGYLIKQKSIAVYKVYVESNDYNEYTEIQEENIVSIYVPVINHAHYSIEKYAKRCIDLMTPLLWNKQNIIFHLNKSNQIKIGQEARKRFGAHIIYTLHYLPNYFSSFAAKTVNPEDVITTGNVLDKEIVAEADHVICVTRFASEVLSQHFAVPKERMTVIYNGCSHPKISEKQYNNREHIRKQLGFPCHDSIILFVGRLQKDKGIEKLIKAYHHLSNSYENLRLVLIGTGEFDQFLGLCQSNVGRITFTGKLSGEVVKEFYQIADIGVVPSEFEQCSYVALEMMQYGLPIVCSDAPGLKELFTNGKSALIVPLQARADGLLGLEITGSGLYETIKQLLENKPFAKQMGKIARKNWENNYTAAHMGQATIQVYQQLQDMNLEIIRSANNQVLTK